MKFDFDKPVNRRGSNSYKWDSDHAKGYLPLWVADMDFEAAPCIMEALQKRLNHKVFGYTIVPQSYYDAVSNWFATRHNWKGISKENIIYTIGVVPAISAILQALCKPGDKVLIHAPQYNCFYSSIRNSECVALESELLRVNNHYEVDWADFEKKMAEARIFLLCNPSNPVGRIWTKEELKKMAEIAEKHHVFVISDEIHCEFAFKGYQYTPYANVAGTDQFAICTSCSKAFNVAGLQCANIFCLNDAIRTKIDKQININEICDVNPFGPVAMEAAYTDGGEWIDQLMEYIQANYLYLKQFIQENIPSLQVTEIEGTYLAWVDCSSLFHGDVQSSAALETDIAEKTGVLFNAGEMYGACGKNFLRINLACQRTTLEKAMELLKNYCDNL